MKRPLSVVGITMFSVLFVLCRAENAALSLSSLLVFSLCFLLCMIIKKSRQSAFLPAVFGSAAAACLLLLCFESFVVLPAQKAVVERGEVTAVVLETPYESENKKRLYFTAEIVSVDGKSVGAKARLSFPNEAWSRNTPILPRETRLLEPGDRLTFTGKVYPIAENYREIRAHYKSLKILLGAYPLGKVESEKGAVKNLYTVLKKERQKAINQILSAFEKETGGILISLLTGNKTYVSAKLYSSFKRAGAAHLMAVSGLHLSVWITFALETLRKRNALTKGKIVFLMFFVFLVMFFASFSGSVRRAGAMMFLCLFAELFGERSDSFNSLGFSAVCVLFENPYAAANAGFVLSFLSVLTMLLIALPFSNAAFSKLKGKLRRKRGEKLFSAVITSVFVSVFVTAETLPFQLKYFSGFSVTGVLTNLLLLPVAAPAVVLGGLYVMFYFLPVVSNVLLFLSGFAADYLKNVCSLLASPKFAFVSVSSKGAIAFSAFVAVLVAVLSLWFEKRKGISDYV